MTILRRTLGFLSLALLACGPGAGGKTIDEVAAAATANCEASTPQLKMANENMLPGRSCLNCHRQGGQAAEYIWTAAGTVFGSPSASCNSGGVAGVKVEILSADGMTVQETMTTNAVGNFYTSKKLTFPIRARISKGGKTQEMLTPQSTGACASCHQNPGLTGAPGRIFLN